MRHHGLGSSGARAFGKVLEVPHHVEIINLVLIVQQEFDSIGSHWKCNWLWRPILFQKSLSQ